MTDSGSIAAELYGLRPQEFVAARDGAARQARADGDRPLAAELAALRKPTVSAWLANLLVRDDAALAAQLPELGAGLRAAQASLDGEQLRELDRQRRRLVASLVARARGLASSAGVRVADSALQELDRTLTAALADPEIAAEVLSGRLTGPREHVGFGAAAAPGPHLAVVRDAVPASAAPAGAAAAKPSGRPAPTRRSRLTVTEPPAARPAAAPAESPADRRARVRAQERAAAQVAAAAAARAALERARSELESARERQRTAEQARAQAEDGVARWDDVIATARPEITALERELRTLTASLERVRTRLADAERERQAAAAALTSARHGATTATAAVRAAKDAVAKATRAAARHP
ncbi:hypothetical protein [Pengzhenrongella sicca]|uniref:Uncharacterized protein n=1 Tax=Pengzhenrongella sicca TaxID=2819238 RepID=A0A8A4ZK55_9MICO|nr:hypothetical protein [Pengzhenrongella sicca]QTE30896.1 hypothetical protein J4E96_08210 [Pengzhenrongella sicca]